MPNSSHWRPALALFAAVLPTLCVAQADRPSGAADCASERVEQIPLDTSLTPVSLLGDGVTDTIAAIAEPMADSYSADRFEVLADASRAKGPTTGNHPSAWRRGDFQGVPILGNGVASAPYFRALIHAGCAHELVAFYRKSVAGRSVAIYAARAALDQNAFTTWDDDLDHATEKLTLYVLRITRRSDRGDLYDLAFVQAAPAQDEAPTCDPRSFDSTFVSLIHANADVTTYPGR